MTRADFLARFPHATEATIRANVDEFVTRSGAAPALTRERPAAGKETKPARKQSNKPPAETSDEFYHRYSQAPAAILERSPRDGAVVPHAPEGRNPVRFLVLVTSFRRRLIDEDNLCEKYVVDCCRYAGLLPGDAPETTSIEVRQQKVARAEDERTEVTIIENDVGQTALPL